MINTEMQMFSLRQAIHYFGSQGDLAKVLGVSQQSISMWLTRKSVPPVHAVTIWLITGIPLWRLMPAPFAPYRDELVQSRLIESADLIQVKVKKTS